MTNVAARAALQHALNADLTPKEHVMIAESEAKLDYYESLRNSGHPCWYIRRGIQGPALTDLFRSPKAAWKDAYKRLVSALGKLAA